MGRMRQHPRYHVVSLRVSDDELEMLGRIAQELELSKSEIMRAAFTSFFRDHTAESETQAA